MDSAGNQFLAGSTFAGDENACCADALKLADFGKNLCDSYAFSDKALNSPVKRLLLEEIPLTKGG
jgi:hypothetical protein